MYNKKAIFFDRDGVINKLVTRDGGLYSPRLLKDFIFYDDIKPCIDYLIEKQIFDFYYFKSTRYIKKKNDY
jgi:histidinol phosphatase-like enzyme